MNTQNGRNPKDDEIFLIEFLNDFHNRISFAKNIDEIENKTIKWINVLEDFQCINSRTMIGLMENHQKNDLWFSSLIGFFYQHGIGECEVNQNKALESYLLAVNTESEEYLNHFNDDLKKYNIIIGKHLLALYYYKEIIVNNRAKQFANKTNLNARHDVGDCYQYDKNEKKTFKWHLKSAKENSDAKKTFKWYLKSAEGGNSEIQYSLGYCYQYGKGTNENENKAFEWYLKSAKKGNSKAQLSLGYFYKYGKGTNRDAKKAYEWILKSAEKGNSDAQASLGECYQYGIGTDKNIKKAFAWYLKSAEKGNSDAQYNLGECYYYGRGTDRDMKSAFE